MRYNEARPEVVLDIECYRNYFLVMFKEVERGRKVVCELYDGQELDRARIARILRTYRVFTFNGQNYDMLLLPLAMRGASCEELKAASDRIIVGKLRPWQFRDRYGVSLPSFVDHIDLMEVAPGQAGLKLYGGRMHSRRLQDLPIEPDAWITPEQRSELVSYCENDLDTTIDLRRTLAKQIDLRVMMSREYGIDLRSKSDAQVAEAVIKGQIEQMLGRRVERPQIDPGSSFRYRVPRFIDYRLPQLRDVLDAVREARFVIGADGKVVMPEELESAKIAIGNSVHRMGIGGLHSSEKSITYRSDERYVLIDRDVTSYYPYLILTAGLAPRHLGQAFLDAYRSHVDARVAAKRAGDKIGADSRKIMVNGTFGKLGSPYSIFYSPDLMIQVTLTGQLALLLLIEWLELAGIEVISANTDGVVSKVPRDRIDDFNAIIFDWEVATGFDTEETRYRSLHSRDVNNYVAITEDGQVKLKGAYAPTGLQKNPTNAVCVDAVVAYLTEGVPLADTIDACDDVRRFLSVRQVNGGAVKDGVYLGKTIRWYYAVGERGAIHYQTNGNAVPMSVGARPLMELPDRLPDDIDYDWYVREAHGILRDIGVDAPSRPVPRNGARREGFALARLPGAKNIHTVDLATEVALCGKTLPGRHDQWVEYATMPAGHRECPKCVKAIGGL